jgi:hypothetical protein
MGRIDCSSLECPDSPHCCRPLHIGSVLRRKRRSRMAARLGRSGLGRSNLHGCLGNYELLHLRVRRNRQGCSHTAPQLVGIGCRLQGRQRRRSFDDKHPTALRTALFPLQGPGFRRPGRPTHR